MTNKHFGAYVREKRLSLDIGLRRICMECDLQVNEWAQIERGERPPVNINIEEIAALIEEDYQSLKMLADISAARIYLNSRLEEDFIPAFPLCLRGRLVIE